MAHLFFLKIIGRHILKDPTPSYVPWHGGERVGSTSHLFLARDPFVGRQELTPQLPDIYSHDASCICLKRLVNYHLYLILFDINQIKKVEDSYEIKIYLFKIIGFLIYVRTVSIYKGWSLEFH